MDILGTLSTYHICIMYISLDTGSDKWKREWTSSWSLFKSCAIIKQYICFVYVSRSIPRKSSEIQEEIISNMTQIIKKIASFEKTLFYIMILKTVKLLIHLLICDVIMWKIYSIVTKIVKFICAIANYKLRTAKCREQLLYFLLITKQCNVILKFHKSTCIKFQPKYISVILYTN